MIDAEQSANIDPVELPISAELSTSLAHWAEAYDKTLNQNDPHLSGFVDKVQEQSFYALGDHLAQRLAKELAGRYRVEYFDGRTNMFRIVNY
ncbi:hypothetical protein ABT336_04525 [Micromonospora sp. NPDC000207]|uniref:hypothetical protein n=1 Tax=Micromonospora sp. NPDC000207 TaxID=3154246 RepID=UPI003330EDFE